MLRVGADVRNLPYYHARLGKEFVTCWFRQGGAQRLANRSHGVRLIEKLAMGQHGIEGGLLFGALRKIGLLGLFEQRLGSLKTREPVLNPRGGSVPLLDVLQKRGGLVEEPVEQVVACQPVEVCDSS